MRIVSLLPSLTELVCALGCEEQLVGLTHECDFPPGVERLPHLTRSRIPACATSGEIDAMVAEQGGSLYELDAKLLAELCPDLVLTQAQCDVCAVNEARVRDVANRLPGRPHVESVNPTSLAGVHAMFRRIGELLGPQSRWAADALVSQFEATREQIGRLRDGKARPRLALLEWFDPPFAAGHWNPEIIALAGADEVLGAPGEKSRRLSWSDVAAADPDVILLSPCGFTLDRTLAELPVLAALPEWQALRAVREGRVAIADGSAYFSRPGPRLEASLRIAAAAIDPAAYGEMAQREAWRPLGLQRLDGSQ